MTDPVFTERYWHTTLLSDWKTGSTVVWQSAGVTLADPEQVVLESDPHRRLTYTWHSFTPELAAAHGFTDELRSVFGREPRSQVTFELEPLGQLVKLTVIHRGFEPGSTVLGLISQGWPAILASLKTLLETGAPLPLD